MTNETTDINLINIFNEGPEVSLNGSPTVSPTTDALCASDPLPKQTLLKGSFLYHFFCIIPSTARI